MFDTLIVLPTQLNYIKNKNNYKTHFLKKKNI